MLTAVKVVNWIAIAIWVLDRAPLAVPELVAVLPYAVALYAFRTGRTEGERWGATAVNAAAVLYYTWTLLSGLVGDNPQDLYGIAVFLAYNILPCILNAIVLAWDVFAAPVAPEPGRRHCRGGW